jgi:hypothetical protein
MSYYACIRCGMCCIVAPCGFSGIDSGDCSYLTVNDDNTTTCHNKNAKKTFVDNGIGCIFQKPEAHEMYEIHMDEYRVNEHKKELRRCNRE